MGQGKLRYDSENDASRRDGQHNNIDEILLPRSNSEC